MNYSFHKSAVLELKEAMDYYEKQKKGMGLNFCKEIFSTIERIILYPNAWIKLSKDSHRCIVKRFPYGIVYQILEKEIIIIAVMQLNRKPDYWKNRIK